MHGFVIEGHIFKERPTALQTLAYYDDVVIVNQLPPKAKEQ